MGRIVSRAELVSALEAERRAGRRIVFTNGCFDLLHAGHVRALRDARSLGDLLVVGLNDDDSVRRQGKGPERPILPEGERAEVLAALEMVDYVCLFAEDTPLELVRAVRPDVIVKGGDWAAGSIVGADLVTAAGGRVANVPYHRGLSTTDIIRRIRATGS